MKVFKLLPPPSERMGVILALSSIKDICIIEYGPEGTMHYAFGLVKKYNLQSSNNFFTTGMKEKDAVFGDVENLKTAIVEIDNKYNPKVIFVITSSICDIIGTDVMPICKECSLKVKAKIAVFENIGFDRDFSTGIERVYTQLANLYSDKSRKKEEMTCNILGMSIDTYNYLSDLKELKRILKEYLNCSVNSVFTANSSVSEIENSNNASFNIVLRKEALQCAQIYKERSNIPYYYGKLPYGLKGTINWIKEISEKFSIKINEEKLKAEKNEADNIFRNFIMFQRTNLNKDVILSGNYDMLRSIYGFFNDELKFNIKKLIVNHDNYNHINKENDLYCFYHDELQVIKTVESFKNALILGDGILCNEYKNKRNVYQISNPNYNKINLYEFTPYVGFRGALYLIQELRNFLEEVKNESNHKKSE